MGGPGKCIEVHYRGSTPLPSIINLIFLFMRNILKEAFDGLPQHDDKEPLFSRRHPVYISKDIEIVGIWLSMYDAIRAPYIKWNEEGSWDYKSEEDKVACEKTLELFKILFLKYNE